MLVPKYFPKFKCIAARCRHNCCIGWEIGVDEDTLQKYRALKGQMGHAIREGLLKDDEGVTLRLNERGRCVHLDEKGLCRIISGLGEEYLCEICREHPRFYHTVGGREEGGIGASCEEAARLILAESDYATMVHPDGAPAAITSITGADFDAFARRAALYAALFDRASSYGEKRRRVARDFALPRGLSDETLAALLCELEYFDQAHLPLLQAAVGGLMTDVVEAERFLAYLVYRHASPAENEREFRCGVSFALLVEALFCRLVGSAELSPVEAARILSLELEYSEENTEAIRFALEMENL